MFSRTLYAIQLRNTDKFLPSGKKSRGFSHDELATFNGPFAPRLFEKESAAKAALRAWKCGPWESVYETSDWYGTQTKIGATPARKQTRYDVDLIVVPVELRVP